MQQHYVRNVTTASAYIGWALVWAPTDSKRTPYSKSVRQLIRLVNVSANYGCPF